MRNIAPNETCLSAQEISDLFLKERGVELHATNVGTAAKNLGLDYVEVDVPKSEDQPWMKKQRRYSEADVPSIFEVLQELADRRAQFQ